MTEEGKVAGLTGACLDYIYMSGLFDYILVEADGAKGKALKFPGEGEPVLPGQTTLVIPVVGINSLDCPLTAQYVHREKLLVRLGVCAPGELVTPGVIGRVVSEYASRAGNLAAARLVPVINKADSQESIGKARHLAKFFLLSRQIPRVVVTSTIKENPVQEVMRWFQS
ncbi:hypothetical protein N752_25405 [Desulforamulus aquiferis]|nr:selenium cofactor biosynthesis protein YqeC [Desulforamulus aquiferis]RYD02661.1 hypothetical protein N752_25405 [Desulforamulus aquiferis]